MFDLIMKKNTHKEYEECYIEEKIRRQRLKGMISERGNKKEKGEKI
jgi:hypothetical protein